MKLVENFNREPNCFVLFQLPNVSHVHVIYIEPPDR